MIGLDTNILIRFLTQDDPAQARIANAIMEQRLTTETPGYVSLVTLAETVWVLERTYRYSAQEIATAVEHILSTGTLVIQNRREIENALGIAEASAASLADALICALTAAAGCSVTLTFDRRAARLPGFALAS